MKHFFNKRKGKYLSVSLVLTLLVLVSVIILNVISALLASRYDFMYIDMNSAVTYDISDECRDYLEEFVIPKAENSGERLEIIFADSEENIKADSSLRYIHDSVEELADIFEGNIEIKHIDIWNDPDEARKYGVTSTRDVVCRFGERYETLNMSGFYIFGEDNSTAIAYNGEKMLASAFMRVTQENTPLCCFTANHGEEFGDYELIRTVSEAGYDIEFLDLFAEDIPKECDMIITFDPKQDLIVSNSLSSSSETDKLSEFMDNGGKYFVFLSADTFVSGGHENLEGFLAEWGVKYMHTEGEDGIEECFMVRDTSNALSVDGYTFYSQNAEKGIGASLASGLPENNVFANSAYISFAEGYTYDGEGNMISDAYGKQRRIAPLMLSNGSAVAWARGIARARAADDPFMLMTVTEQECENGETAYLICSGSVEFASEEHMKSAVIGNSRTLMGIFAAMGKENAPASLTFKPFGSTEIESLTTKNANITTVLLALIPALTAAVIGTVVLVRRRNR